jgi:Na+/H+ antiporter NhaD/arsenite permease-like protein
VGLVSVTPCLRSTVKGRAALGFFGATYLWLWHVNFAAALGANTSLIGAANDMVTAGIAERIGYSISYWEFLKAGLPAAVLTLIVGTLWILICF